MFDLISVITSFQILYVHILLELSQKWDTVKAQNTKTEWYENQDDLIKSASE